MTQNSNKIENFKITLQESKQLEEIQNLVKQNAIMRQLATTKGFFNAYFEACKIAKTVEEAFYKTNELYFSVFNQYRYKDYISFKMMQNYYN